jgi:hypothetical protein
MRQENVYVLHHECEEIKFFRRKMNFVIATPEHVTLQIQPQLSDLNQPPESTIHPSLVAGEPLALVL